MADATPVTIETPVDKHIVDLKPSLTGFDQEQINVALNRTDEKNDLDGEALANRKSFELIVLSVDGNSQGVVEAVLGMDVTDYRFVVGEINKLNQGLPAEKKTASTETSVSSPPSENSTTPTTS